jgi:hypothetical protein
LERLDQFGRGSVATLAVLHQAGLHDRVEPWLADRGRVVVQHRGESVGDRVAGERAPPAQHLVQHGAEREEIGARVGGLAAHLLRRHVSRRPHHHPALGRPGHQNGVVSVAGGRAILEAREAKSRILATPSLVTNTFSGFKSRWISARACAAPRPRAICVATSSASRGSMRPCESRSRSVPPRNNSVTTYDTPSSRPTS